MIGQSFTFTLLLTVISSTYSKDPVTIMNNICSASMKAIDEGYFELRINERAECRAKAVPEGLLEAVNRCEDTLPMSTVDQVNKACSDRVKSAPIYEQQWICKEKAFGANYKYIFAYAECSLKKNPE